MSSTDDSDADHSVVIIKEESRSPSPAERRHSKHNTSSKSYKTNKELMQECKFRHKDSIKNYLKRRDTLHIIDPALKKSALDADDILGDDEEVWLVQCSRNVDIETIVGTNLNLNGDRHKVKGGSASLEYSSELIGEKNQNFVNVMCKKNGKRRIHHQIISLKPAGIIRVQNKLKVCFLRV